MDLRSISFTGVAMNVIHGLDHVPANARGAALAIGNFDGVHRGHQALLRATRDAARGLASGLPGVMVFEPHPRRFFNPSRPFFEITPLDQKIRLLGRFGMSMVVVIPFSAAIAELEAPTFVERVLVAGLGVGHVVVGYDFHYGRGRGGTIETLREAGRSYGFGVTIIDQIADAGEVVSSSAIRAELAQGDVRGAAELLGYHWRAAGTIVSGAQRGTGLGYPTANMALPPGTTLGHGIYAVRVHTADGVFGGAAYLGTRPTFDGGLPVLETFLLEFSGDLYGQRIEIEFIEHIRGDRQFDSAEALVTQMDVDVAQIRRVLAQMQVARS